MIHNLLILVIEILLCLHLPLASLNPGDSKPQCIGSPEVYIYTWPWLFGNFRYYLCAILGYLFCYVWAILWYFGAIFGYFGVFLNYFWLFLVFWLPFKASLLLR